MLPEYLEPLRLLGFLVTSASLALGTKLYQMPLISTASALASMGRSIKRIDNNTFFIIVYY